MVLDSPAEHADRAPRGVDLGMKLGQARFFERIGHRSAGREGDLDFRRPVGKRVYHAHRDDTHVVLP